MAKPQFWLLKKDHFRSLHGSCCKIFGVWTLESDVRLNFTVLFVMTMQVGFLRTP